VMVVAVVVVVMVVLLLLAVFVCTGFWAAFADAPFFSAFCLCLLPADSNHIWTSQNECTILKNFCLGLLPADNRHIWKSQNQSSKSHFLYILSKLMLCTIFPRKITKYETNLMLDNNYTQDVTFSWRCLIQAFS
jgi:hypothetical protein